MKKILVAVSIIAALAVGYFAGRFHAGRVWRGILHDNMLTRASVQAHFCIRVLTDFREGNQTNALDFLESNLDGSLLTFLPLESTASAHRDVAGLLAIRSASIYRGKYPWTNSEPELREAVEKLMSLNSK